MAIDYGTFYWSSGSGGGGGGGGGAGSAQAAGTAPIGNAASSISVVYGTALGSALIPLFSFNNIVDSDPIFIQGFVSAYSTAGFTVTFNAPTDSANYTMSYAAFGAV